MFFHRNKNNVFVSQPNKRNGVGLYRYLRNMYKCETFYINNLSQKLLGFSSFSRRFDRMEVDDSNMLLPVPIKSLKTG